MFFTFNITYFWYFNFGYDKNMNRCLGFYVSQSKDRIVFVNYVGGNLCVDNFRKDCVSHLILPFNFIFLHLIVEMTALNIKYFGSLAHVPVICFLLFNNK